MSDLAARLADALRGRYTIQRELGRGGMAIVYLAHDQKLDRDVALKVLLPELAASVGPERFLREIEIAAKLAHPNILSLYDCGDADGQLYYTMPVVDGESLRDRLHRERQLSIDEAIRIATEVADALAYAHSLGVVHRDIKPENILFAAGHAVVSDFGIARAVSAAGGATLTETGLAVGTPAYMSPEQAAGDKEVDGRSDIYSLGCVLYEMLSGDAPYLASTPQAVMAKKWSEPTPRISVVRDTVTPGVEAAIMRALAKVPADRYATGFEFARALTSRDEAPPEEDRGGLFARSKLLAIASVVVVLAAAAYVTLAISGGRSESPVVAVTVDRLTTDPGVERFPSLSPDGEWVVYSGEASGNRDVYLLSVGGVNAINLTADSPEDDDQPAFSPDGDRIAFRSARDDGGIFVMGRTGESVRRVTRFGFNPSWNPDGTQIAFSTESVDLNPQNSETVGELWIVDVGSGETRRVTDVDATLPSWSPHGQRIAFSNRISESVGGHIWTVPVDGGTPTPVTEGVSRNWDPAWSPDGRYLYFVSDRGGSMNLWRVRIEEASGRPLDEPAPVTTPATSLAHVSISSDGKHIAFSSVLVTSNVQRLAFDPVRGVVDGEPEWVTRGSRRWANPEPSPDGEFVAFYSLVEPEGDLYVMRADGSGAPRQVTADSASDRMPRWSPDGAWIAAFSDRSGPFEIWKIRPDGSGLTQVTKGQGISYTVWSPDGTRMLGRSIEGGHGVTLMLDPTRSWSEQQMDTLSAPPDSLLDFAPHSWSQNGSYVAGQINAVDEGVIIYGFDTGRYERLTDYGQWPVWLPDSRRLLFVSGGKAFYVVDRETRQVREVFSVARDVIGPPQATRDGTMMYFTRRVTEADVYVAMLR